MTRETLLLKAASYGITPTDQMSEEQLSLLVNAASSDENGISVATHKFYAFTPSWVHVTHHPEYKTLTPAYIEYDPDAPYAFCQIHLFKRRPWLKFGVSDQEILDHEAAHVGRLALESKFDEYFAYSLSPRKWKKWISLAFDNLFFSVLLFIWSSLLLAMPMTFDGPYFDIFYYSSFALGVGLLFFPLASAFQVNRIEKAINFLELKLGLKGQGAALIYRMKDEEILHLSESSDSAEKWLQSNLDQPPCLRWEQIKVLSEQF